MYRFTPISIEAALLIPLYTLVLQSRVFTTLLPYNVILKNGNTRILKFLIEKKKKREKEKKEKKKKEQANLSKVKRNERKERKKKFSGKKKYKKNRLIEVE